MAEKDIAGTRVSEVRRIYDRAAARRYREQDEVALAKGGSKRHYCEILERLTRSFDRKIDVLDAGCGTGRYFQCLRNVRRLVGVDISEHMIEEARNPVARGKLDVESIELHVGDVSSLNLRPASFDFICSLGVIGEFAPVDAALLDRFASLLKDDGVVFFTAVDTHSRTAAADRNAPLLRRAAPKLFPYLARSIRAALNKRLAPNYLSRNELSERLDASPFASFEITSYEHPPGGWAGVHFDTIAYKGQANRAS
jgi:SAM-dependent methyltransferase